MSGLSRLASSWEFWQKGQTTGIINLKRIAVALILPHTTRPSIKWKKRKKNKKTKSEQLSYGVSGKTAGKSDRRKGYQWMSVNLGTLNKWCHGCSSISSEWVLGSLTCLWVTKEMQWLDKMSSLNPEDKKWLQIPGIRALQSSTMKWVAKAIVYTQNKI